MTRLPLKHCGLIFTLILAVAPFAAQALTPSQVFDKVKDTVVVIKSLNAKGEPLGQGSGVMLPTGKVATNCHVVKDGARFQAGRDNSFVPATLFAADADKDICLLQADKLTGTPAQLGKAGTLKVGEAVYAVGAPQGLELSLSNGLVSQLRGGTPPLIQTTAAISQGSSGGGLFDSEARLVGFTTYYYKDGQSLNFAMPVEWLADIKPGKPATQNTKRSQLEWLTRAAALTAAKEWQKLLSWTIEWTKAEPQNVAAWNHLGFVYRDLKHHDNAITAHRQAILINPEDTYSWYFLGGNYFMLNRYDDAISAYRQAIRINPENAGAWHNLGITYHDLNRYDDAITAYRQAIRIDPEHANAWFNLGTSYSAFKRNEDAIAAYHQAVRINPEDAVAWLRLGLAYSLSGNKTAALQAASKLRSLDPVKAEILFNLIMPK